MDRLLTRHPLVEDVLAVLCGVVGPVVDTVATVVAAPAPCVIARETTQGAAAAVHTAGAVMCTTSAASCLAAGSQWLQLVLLLLRPPSDSLFPHPGKAAGQFCVGYTALK